LGGLFAGQASFGRCVSKTEWVYGFKVALSVSPEGVVTAFGLAEANSTEWPIGEFLGSSDEHDAFLADKVAEELDANLIVIGCRGRNAVRRALMGSVSDSVVRHAHCPVLVARG
jgi:hypothetical protein